MLEKLCRLMVMWSVLSLAMLPGTVAMASLPDASQSATSGDSGLSYRKTRGFYYKLAGSDPEYEYNLWRSKQCWAWMPQNDRLCNPHKWEAEHGKPWGWVDEHDGWQSRAKDTFK